MIFKTSFDGLTKLITVVVGVVLAAMPYQIIKAYPHNPGGAIAGSFFLVVTFLLCWLFHSSKYSIHNGSLIIHRPIHNVSVAISEIKSAEPIGNLDLLLTLRVFGVGGVFGYFGKFYNSKLGRMTWYATRRNNVVLLTTKDSKKILFTPDAPTEFVNELNHLIHP